MNGSECQRKFIDLRYNFKTDGNGQISMIDSVILKNIVRMSTARPPLEIL